MQIQENISLSGYSTMRLGGNARWLAKAASQDDVSYLVNWAAGQDLPVIIVGQGSNIVWRDAGFEGLVIVNSIMGREVLGEDARSVTIRIGGGEVWDEVARRAAEHGWSGIEFLSLIPGTAGAAPVQNIGAYGAELSKTLVEVHAYDKQTKQFVTLPAAECGFAYRTSRFKAGDKGRFFITHITLKLSKTPPAPPFYDALAKYFEEHPASEFTSTIVREAVIAVRSSKLPDPALVANNGSFFTNPIIRQDQFDQLKLIFPDIRGWPGSDGMVKLAAGWLVEQAGFKGIHDEQTGMATWDKQALVLVNEHAKSTADLLAFKQKIVEAVEAKFGVVLEQEPELLP